MNKIKSNINLLVFILITIYTLYIRNLINYSGYVFITI